MPKLDDGLDFFGTDGFCDSGLPYGSAEDWFGIDGWGSVAVQRPVWEVGVDMSSDSFVGADMSSDQAAGVDMSSDVFVTVAARPEA